MAKYEYDYPHPAVATDCVVFGFDGRSLKVLLVERGIDPYKGMWAFPGGFMRMDETAEDCARRELQEETGLQLNNIRQLGAFSGVNRDPRERIVTIAFYALARQSEVRGGDDAANAHWWTIDEVPQLAFDHDYILRQALNRIRRDIHFEPVGFGLLEEEFTIADLQRLYESILGVRFDRRNFYSKMLKTGILQEVVSEPSAKPMLYGKPHSDRQMRIRHIKELLGGEPDMPVKCCLMPSSAPNTGAQEDLPLAEERHTVGRKGRLFRFNKESYNRLKESNAFRLEF